MERSMKFKKKHFAMAHYFYSLRYGSDKEVSFKIIMKLYLKNVNKYHREIDTFMDHILNFDTLSFLSK